MDAKFINFVATTKNGYVAFGTGGQKMDKKINRICINICVLLCLLNSIFTKDAQWTIAAAIFNVAANVLEDTENGK